MNFALRPNREACFYFATLVSRRHNFPVSPGLQLGWGGDDYKSQAEMAAENLAVEPGDTIDFIVDIGDNLNSDQFLWKPVIAAEKKHWETKPAFTGPTSAPDYFKPWEQYVQVLPLANEFVFVD